MKTRTVQDMNLLQKQIQKRFQCSNQGRKSPENIKEGHMNPLKMKTSFLRQSFNVNSNEQSASLIFPTSSHSQTKEPLKVDVLTLQKKQDFIKRKITDRGSKSPNQKDKKYPEATDCTVQSFRDREIIKLSGRKNDYLSASIGQKGQKQEKENKIQSLSYSTVQQNGVYQKNQVQLSCQQQQRGNRFSSNSTFQSVVLDNSLADYTSNLNLSFLNQDSSISIMKDQIQLVLKRLAKNQCDIETLKREKNLDVHLQGVWRQLSLYQSKFQSHQKQFNQFDDKVISWNKEIQGIKCQLQQLNQGRNSLYNGVKDLESKFLLEIYKKEEKLSNSLSLEIYPQSQVEKSFQKQFQVLLKKLNDELQSKIESKLNELKNERKQDRFFKVFQVEQDRIQQDAKRGKFVVSGKRSHDFIDLVYKEVIKVRRNSRSSSYIESESSQICSDRSKLLANAFNHPKSKLHLSHVSFQEQFTRNEFSSTCEENDSEIEINSVEYFIDPEGYLLDSNQFYILDQKDQQIQIDANTIEVLRKQNVLKG